jgi:FtsP/CotA-like multicopper oxidase with cupredoxin domain
MVLGQGGLMEVSRRRLLGGAAAGIGAATVAACSSSSKGSTPIEPDPATLSSPFAKLVVPTGQVREYWIQADSFRHNVVPTGHDGMMGLRFESDGSSFWALGYRAYTEDWKALLPASDDIGPNSGIPGPIIRAEVGDTVRVHFRNNDTHYRFPHSMHPHGCIYTPANDGVYLVDEPNVPGRVIPFGSTYTYEWKAAPSSVGTWLYHDHSMAQDLTGSGVVMEINAELGLFGLVAITDTDTVAVNREFFLFFHDLYAADIPGLAQDFDCFNGAAYLGNTPEMRAKVGDKVRWRIAALGKELHVFHVHGHRWLSSSGRFVDSEMLGPSTTLTVEYTEDNPGSWIYHGHVTDHMAGGMVGQYTVES